MSKVCAGEYAQQRPDVLESRRGPSEYGVRFRQHPVSGVDTSFHR